MSDSACGAPILISCDNLRHSYGGPEILHGLSFTVRQGGIVGLLGKNGAGKSTVINILMGFLRPDSGRCRVLGHPSHSIPPAVREHIGLLHEGFVQYNFMTVGQIERYYAAYYPAWERDLYYDLVNRMEVPHSRVIAKMSCGQRSQVTLGLILAQNPKIMLLDDFSMGLDVGYRRLFLEFLRDYADTHNTTVLLTSHIVQELDGILDEVVVIHKGATLFNGPRRDFLRHISCYELPLTERSEALKTGGAIVGLEPGKHSVRIFCTKTPHEELCALPDERAAMRKIPLSFEDAFVGLTGRY